MVPALRIWGARPWGQAALKISLCFRHRRNAAALGGCFSLSTGTRLQDPLEQEATGQEGNALGLGWEGLKDKQQEWDAPVGNCTKLYVILLRGFVRLCSAGKRSQVSFKRLFQHWTPDELNISPNWE